MNTYRDIFMESVTRLNGEQLRKILTGVALDNFNGPEEEMTPEERKEYVAKAHLALPLVKRELTTLLRETLIGLGMEAESVEQVLFRRGGINLIDLVLERFERLSDEHMANLKDAQERDVENPHQPITPVGT